jgi:hypothetical protein
LPPLPLPWLLLHLQKKTILCSFCAGLIIWVFSGLGWPDRINRANKMEEESKNRYDITEEELVHSVSLNLSMFGLL